MDIHIFWDGPFTLEEIGANEDQNKDYGIYQIYGHHRLYGKDVLLYIGKANQQTFYTRLKQEYWHSCEDPENTKYYLGRIASRNINDDWDLLIDSAEKLLIYAHNPVENIVNTNRIDTDELKNIHIFNWDSFRDLLPEVSWKRWSEKFDNITIENIFELDIDE